MFTGIQSTSRKWMILSSSSSSSKSLTNHNILMKQRLFQNGRIHTNRFTIPSTWIGTISTTTTFLRESTTVTPTTKTIPSRIITGNTNNNHNSNSRRVLSIGTYNNNSTYYYNNDNNNNNNNQLHHYRRYHHPNSHPATTTSGSSSIRFLSSSSANPASNNNNTSSSREVVFHQLGLSGPTTIKTNNDTTTINQLLSNTNTNTNTNTDTNKTNGTSSDDINADVGDPNNKKNMNDQTTMATNSPIIKRRQRRIKRTASFQQQYPYHQDQQHLHHPQQQQQSSNSQHHHHHHHHVHRYPKENSNSNPTSSSSIHSTNNNNHNGYFLPVSAIHIAERIDLLHVFSKVFNRNNHSIIQKKLYGKKKIPYGVVQLANNDDSNDDGDNIIPTTTTTSNHQQLNDDISSSPAAAASSMILLPPPPKFVAIFSFGSVVLFNVPSHEASVIISNIKKYASDLTLYGSEREEKYSVFVQPPPLLLSSSMMEEEVIEQQQQQEDNQDYNSNNNNRTISSTDRDNINNHDMVQEENDDEQRYQQQQQQQQQQQSISSMHPKKFVTPEYCIVEEPLDMNGVAVISNIMAQTVALDAYSDTVDELLNNFASINATVKKTGKFTPTDKNFLFKTIAQNNSILIDMISKTRIKDRNDTAWNLTKYQDIHDGLKNEFEIDDRFETIELKLDLIQQNAKFFMEVIHYKSSNMLEWIIILLILAECMLMCFEMSGNGGYLFNTILQITPNTTTTTTGSDPVSSSILAGSVTELGDAFTTITESSSCSSSIPSTAADASTGTT